MWLAVMHCEHESLEKRKAFKGATPPPGHKPMGICWTYDYKHNPDGTIIWGKEKPVVAQGFSQWPENYGEMYAPVVVKLSSVWILLAYTNHYDLEIMSFNVKTAFLHAHSPYDIFIKQIPGFPEANTSTPVGHIVWPQTILLQMV